MSTSIHTTAGDPPGGPDAERTGEALRAERDEFRRLLALGAEVTGAFARTQTLQAALQEGAQSVVDHVGAAFARIWTLDSAGTTLLLEASAGLYTHLDGPHGRVPVGQFKIGLIAEERRAHLTNHVLGDPRVGDQAWAAREGLVAFAGYPLLAGDRLLGVVALFARHALDETTLRALEVVSQTVAAAVARARDQDSLVRSEARLTAVLAGITEGVVVTDEAGQVTFLNKAAGALLGDQASAARGLPHHRVLTFLDEASGQPADSPLTAALLGGPIEGPRTPLLLRRPDGHVVPVELHAAPLRNESGGLTGVVLVLRDATESRRAERAAAELLRVQEAARAELALERQRLYSFLMQAPAGICVLRGPEHIFELANQLYLQLVGGRAIVGLPIRQALPELEGQGIYELLDRVRSSGEPFVGKEILLRVDRLGTGALDEGYFSFIYQPMRELDGRIDAILVHVLEVTEQVVGRKKLELAVAEAQRLGAEQHEVAERTRALLDEVSTQAREMEEAVRAMQQRLGEAEQRAAQGRVDGTTPG